MDNNSERIDKFLRKQMTPEENEIFLNDLKVDADLRKEAQLTALMIKELQERQAKEDVEIIEEVLACKAKAAKKAKIVRMVRWVGAIAAMFILFFGSVKFYKIYQMDTLFDEYYDPAESSRANEDATSHELDSLFNQIGTKKDVRPTIQRLLVIYENRDSIFGDNDYEKNRCLCDIRWYLALAYLKNHDIDKTKELLYVIIADAQSNAYRKDAQELLRKIE